MKELYRVALIQVVLILYGATKSLAVRSSGISLDHQIYRTQSDLSVEKRHCDMEKCDSVVTKCTNNHRCSCDFKNDAFCAKDCLDCLEEKFGKCCACVDLCPPIKEDQRSSSHVGELNATSYEELFDVLTQFDDVHGRWIVANGPSSEEFIHPEHGLLKMSADKKNDLILTHKRSHFEYVDPNLDVDDVPQQDIRATSQQKCAVAFINRQLDMSQCKRYCRSMGASSYRWFHEGCCECVGKFCLRYGIDIPKCQIDY